MISPVIVEVYRSAVTAHCRNQACGAVGERGVPIHLLYAGMDVRDAERRADAHLKDIRAKEATDA